MAVFITYPIDRIEHPNDVSLWIRTTHKWLRNEKKENILKLANYLKICIDTKKTNFAIVGTNFFPFRFNSNTNISIELAN